MYQINQQEFVKAVEEKLKAMEIDFEISSEWYDYAAWALNYASPLTLGITSVEMKELHEKATYHQPLNYRDFAVLSNNLEARTPNEMASLNLNYFETMEKAYHYAELWNIKGSIVNNEVMRDMVQKNNSNLAPVHNIGEA